MPAASFPVAARLVRVCCATATGLAAAVSLVAAGMPPSSPDPASIPGAEFFAVTALSRADAWAVGDVGATTGLLKTLAVHWDGIRWARVPTPSPGVQTAGSTLDAVSGASPADAWAVGSYETSAKVTKNLVLRWDGTRWARVPSPSPGFSALYGVSAVSRTDAWAVGLGGDSLILHWNGHRWTPS